MKPTGAPLMAGGALFRLTYGLGAMFAPRFIAGRYAARRVGLRDEPTRLRRPAHRGWPPYAALLPLEGDGPTGIAPQRGNRGLRHGGWRC